MFLTKVSNSEGVSVPLNSGPAAERNGVDRHPSLSVCLRLAGAGATLRGGLLPALSVSDHHGGRAEPLLERGAAASLQVTAAAPSSFNLAHTHPAFQHRYSCVQGCNSGYETTEVEILSTYLI